MYLKNLIINDHSFQDVIIVLKYHSSHLIYQDHFGVPGSQ